MRMEWALRGAAALVIVVAVIVAMKFKPYELQLNPDITKQFVSFFMGLAAIALFVERAVEVLVTPWREKGAQTRKVAVTSVQRTVKANLDLTKAAVLAPDTFFALANELTTLEGMAKNSAEELAKYRADTQRIAFVVSLAFGTAISLIGFRALDFFVQGGADTSLAAHPHQLLLFKGLDVVLTGAVISGGADGLHQMATIFTNFPDNTKAKTRGD